MKLVSLINSYNLVIFDFDGVIVDSNEIKKKCIYMSVKKNTSKFHATKFTEYFVSNNGIPRKIKIEKYFNKKRSHKILNDYNELLKLVPPPAPLFLVITIALLPKSVDAL